MMTRTPPPAGSVLGSASRVLVLDDDPVARELVEETLRRADLEVVGVATAERALELLAESAFGCVITDIQMPDMDGLQFTSRVAEAAPDTPVVMLTAYPTVDGARFAIDLAVSAYIVKPFEMDDLVRRVRSAIQKGLVARGIASARNTARVLLERLEAIETVLQSPGDTRVPLSARAFADASLETIACALRDLAGVVHGTSVTGAEADSSDLLQAIEDAVETLQRTKNSFKSKEIAALRRQLESIVRDRSSSRSPR